MNEIEVKILEIDKKEVLEKLKNLGAKESFNGLMKATYYKNESFKGKDSLLRLRREGKKTFLTFKRKVSKQKTKIMEEFETAVENPEEMHKILLALGFYIYLEIEKERIQYDFDGVHCAIDTYKKDWSSIPTFMEIEALSEEKVFEMARKLGFSEKDCKPMGGKELYEYYIGHKP